jgi:hypothetical protein
VPAAREHDDKGDDDWQRRRGDGHHERSGQDQGGRAVEGTDRDAELDGQDGETIRRVPVLAPGAEDGSLVVDADRTEAGAPDGHEDHGAGKGSAAEWEKEHRDGDGPRRDDERTAGLGVSGDAGDPDADVAGGAEDGEGEAGGVVGEASFADERRDVCEEREVREDQQRPGDGHGFHTGLGDGLSPGGADGVGDPADLGQQPESKAGQEQAEASQEQEGRAWSAQQETGQGASNNEKA